MKTEEVTNQKILIVGIGWLGLPLALKLKASGFQVFGTTTTHDKELRLQQEFGLQATTFELPHTFLGNNKDSFINFGEAQALILNIPPQKHQFPDRFIIEEFLTWLKKETTFHGKLIFVSSTSVYGQSQGNVDENTVPVPETIGGLELLSAERFIETHFNNYNIIRPGGLIGGARHPVKFLQKKTNVPHGESFLHLVYRDDLVRLIKTLLLEPAPKIINAFSPYAKTKREYYTLMAHKFSLTPPVYQEIENKLNYTKIDASLFEKTLGFAPRSPEDFAFENELFT